MFSCVNKDQLPEPSSIQKIGGVIHEKPNKQLPKYVEGTWDAIYLDSNGRFTLYPLADSVRSNKIVFTNDSIKEYSYDGFLFDIGTYIIDGNNLIVNTNVSQSLGGTLTFTATKVTPKKLEFYFIAPDPRTGKISKFYLILSK